MEIQKSARAVLGVIVLALGCGAIAGPSVATGPAFTVRVDPRVELCAVICRLAGLPEFRNVGIEDYDRAVQAHFGGFTNHPSVEVVRKLHRSRRIGYNAPVGLALAADPKTFTPRVKLNPLPRWLDSRWTSASAREFLAALGKFAEDTQATQFFAGQTAMWRAAESNLKDGIGARLDLDWFERQFGVTTNTHFTIVPGLLNGPQNYGCEVQLADGTIELIAVVATPKSVSGAPISYPIEPMMRLVVHEFSHSFVNPWVDANAKHLDRAARKLFDPVEPAMRKQAYGTARIMIYESIVRANTIRYFLDHGEVASARACVDSDCAGSFYWTEELASVLCEAPQSTPRFPGTADAVFKFFEAWGNAAEQRLAAVKSRREAAERERLARGPQIVKAIPADGDQQVDAGLSMLELHFDRPMDGGMSVFGDPPEISGKPAWNDEKKVLKIPVKLRAGQSYQMWLNKSEETRGGFRSAAGEPLAFRPWRFTVKSGAP